MLRKIVQNKLGLFSLIFIVFLVIISTLGYLITPDSLPKANTINLELALQKPGFKVQTILLERKEIMKLSFFHKMLYGSENNFEMVPVLDVEYPNRYARFSKNGLKVWTDFDRRDI